MASVSSASLGGLEAGPRSQGQLDPGSVPHRGPRASSLPSLTAAHKTETSAPSGHRGRTRWRPGSGAVCSPFSSQSPGLGPGRGSVPSHSGEPGGVRGGIRVLLRREQAKERPERSPAAAPDPRRGRAGETSTRCAMAERGARGVTVLLPVAWQRCVAGTCPHHHQTRTAPQAPLLPPARPRRWPGRVAPRRPEELALPGGGGRPLVRPGPWRTRAWPYGGAFHLHKGEAAAAQRQRSSHTPLPLLGATGHVPSPVAVDVVRLCQLSTCAFSPCGGPLYPHSGQH